MENKHVDMENKAVKFKLSTNTYKYIVELLCW